VTILILENDFAGAQGGYGRFETRTQEGTIMSSHPTRTFAAAAGTALVLTLTACGGGTAEPTDDETPLGPLDTYFEQMYGDYDEDSANAQMAEVEEIVAECMAEQGFEYTPVDYSSQGGMVSSSDDLDVEWGTLEFAEQYGYGATTNPWGEQTPDPEATGEEWVDPNQEYVESMSETEQTAYYAALYGEQTYTEPTEEGEEIEYDWTTAGCQGKAQHDVYESGNGMDDEEFTALQEEMSAMWEASMADPRVAGLDAEWASCMADAGYAGLAAVSDAEQQFYEKVNAVYDEAYTDMDPEAGEDDYLAIEEAIQEQLSALTTEEIETAVADYTCRDEVRYTEIQQEVNFEYQQDFVDEHKDALDAWLEAYQASQS